MTANDRVAYGGKESAATKNNDVRFLSAKIGVQRQKSRDGVMVSTSAREARSPWFNSRSRHEPFMYANIYIYIYIYIYVSWSKKKFSQSGLPKKNSYVALHLIFQEACFSPK